MELPTKLLVVEDDSIQAKSISEALTQQGYECRVVLNGADAVKQASNEQFKVMILELALEDDSGLGVLRCVRETDENISVVVLTPSTFRNERLAALEAGADDFILKPFSMSELVARVEAVLVRSRKKPKTQLEVGPLAMDLTARRVSRSGRNISLTPTEFRILEMLIRNQGAVVTRRMLCEFLWSPEWEGVTNVIEVHINRLRTKITADGEPRLIHTVRGSGYVIRWAPPIDATSDHSASTDTPAEA